MEKNNSYPPEKWLPQWRCTMLHGLYCGYTAGLDATARPWGLPQDKQKLAAGKALIRYFCVPCKSTKGNGGRTRNLPWHDPAKWELFKDYCKQDVVTEMEIERRLSGFPVPDCVQAQWVTDQSINARGVAVDMPLVTGALQLDAQTRQDYVAEAVALTGLDNPNSVAQLSRWLQEETGEEVADLRKDTVADLLGKELPGDKARRVLEIRQELGKTSNKKYTALVAAVCADSRVRGLLQFYGANRTGRWAGRIVQPQNLPRTYIDGALLPLARDLVRRQDAAGLRVVFGSVPDTLSQLIRTAFVAAPGRTLVDADFSAIEARMIAWLAGEEWVLEVFRTHREDLRGRRGPDVRRAHRGHQKGQSGIQLPPKGQGGHPGPGLSGRRRLPGQHGGSAHGHPGGRPTRHRRAVAQCKSRYRAVLVHSGGRGPGRPWNTAAGWSWTGDGWCSPARWMGTTTFSPSGCPAAASCTTPTRTWG